jgi:hypothetical protein
MDGKKRLIPVKCLFYGQDEQDYRLEHRIL